MRKTIRDLIRSVIYVFVYGAEGVGKTLLPMTLADETGHGIAYITSDQSGPTSIISAGFPTDIPVEILPASGADPFEPAMQAINDFVRDRTISVICLDGATVISGRAIDFYSDGNGEKALGWEGWGIILNGFRKIEQSLDRATRAGKSVIITAWEREPTFEDTLAGSILKDEGRPMLHGQAKTWLPGNCDIVARMTSSWVKKPVNGKAESIFQAQLQVNRHNNYLAKCRWKLPDPCRADLKWILSQVSDQAKAVQGRAKSVSNPATAAGPTKAFPPARVTQAASINGPKKG